MKAKKLKSKIDLKQDVISIGNGYPSKREGKDGSITVRQLKGKGLFLFFKHNGIWHSTRLSVRTPKTTEDKESVIIPVGKKPSKKGELSMDSSGKTHVSKGAGALKQVVGADSSKTLDIEEIKLGRTSNAETGGTANTTADMLIKNSGTGNAQLHLQVLDDDADAYIRFSQFDIDPSTKLKQWTVGMDGSQSHRLSFNSRQTGTEPITPSGGHSGDSPKMYLDNSGNLTTAGTVTSSAGVLGVGDITGVTLTGDSGGALSDTAGSADFTIAGGTNCSTSGSGSTITINADAAAVTALNNATANELVTVGATTTELDAEANLTFNGNTLNVTNTSGLANALKISYDATNYGYFNTSSNGSLSIGNTGTAPKVTIGAGNDMELNPTDDFEVDAGGDITLDSADGNFIMKKNGTEFSAANSSYAGMILGYTCIGLNEADASYNLTNSYAVPTDEFSVAFVAPPSGKVEIFIQFTWSAGSSNVGDCFVGLSTANATSGYSATVGHHEKELFDHMSRGAYRILTHRWTIIGLTAGTSYERWVGFKSSSTTGTPQILYGGNASGKYPNFIMKATALPATITT